MSATRRRLRSPPHIATCEITSRCGFACHARADVSTDAPVDAGDRTDAPARQFVDPRRTPAEDLEDKERNGLIISAAAAASRFLETLAEDQRAYFEEDLRGTKRQNMPWPTKKVDQLRRSVKAAFDRFKSTDEAVVKWRAYDQDSGAAR